MRALLLVACLVALCTGCTRLDIDHTPIPADDAAAFSTWRRRVATQLTSAQQEEFEAAIQELRLGIMLKKEASGREAIEEAVSKQVNGHTVKQVWLLADEAKWQRLAAERSDLQRVVNANAQLITKPGDRGAADDLEQYRAKLQQRLDAASAELKTIEARITAHGGNPAQHAVDFTPVAPAAALPREGALREIDTMIEGRRASGTLKHGAWPVKIDREGKQLDEATAREFHDRNAAAAPAGRIVVPIRIKEHWLLYEGPNKAPALPDNIRPNLTSDDLRKFTDDWVNLEAELWARDVIAALPASN